MTQELGQKLNPLFDGRVSRLLSDRTKWTQRADARNVNLFPVQWSDQDAVCWCLSGAVAKCYGPNERHLVSEHLQSVLGVDYGFVTWNDVTGRTWEAVADLLKRSGI